MQKTKKWRLQYKYFELFAKVEDPSAFDLHWKKNILTQEKYNLYFEGEYYKRCIIFVVINLDLSFRMLKLLNIADIFR